LARPLARLNVSPLAGSMVDEGPSAEDGGT
jgi:hypothetical protein